jgi:hypothetical protein
VELLSVRAFLLLSALEHDAPLASRGQAGTGLHGAAQCDAAFIALHELFGAVDYLFEVKTPIKK